MTIYYCTIIIVVLFAYLADRSKSTNNSLNKINDGGRWLLHGLSVFVVAAVLIFVAGFRFHVGADYGNYTYGYSAYRDNWWSYIVSFEEFGFVLVVKIASLVCDKPESMFFLCSLITILLYVLTIEKYSVSFVVGVLLFVFVGTWAGSFNAIRQYLAASILFAGHRLIFKREFLKYCIVVLIAFMFHRTALVMLPTYFIVTKKINKTTILVLILCTIVIAQSYGLLFDVMSSVKGNDQSQYAYMNTKVNFFRVLVTVAPVALFLMMDSDQRKNPEVTFYMMLILVNAVLMIGASGSAHLARVAAYTETYPALAFPLFFQCLKKNIRVPVQFVVLFLYFIFFSYQMNTSPSLSNYQWIFEFPATI